VVDTHLIMADVTMATSVMFNASLPLAHLHAMFFCPSCRFIASLQEEEEEEGGEEGGEGEGDDTLRLHRFLPPCQTSVAGRDGRRRPSPPPISKLPASNGSSPGHSLLRTRVELPPPPVSFRRWPVTGHRFPRSVARLQRGRRAEGQMETTGDRPPLPPVGGSASAGPESRGPDGNDR